MNAAKVTCLSNTNLLSKEKAKVNQIRRGLFNLIQTEIQSAPTFKANKPVTTNIIIRTPVLRAMEHRNVVRVEAKSSAMKLYKLFPTRNTVQVTSQKLTTKPPLKPESNTKLAEIKQASLERHRTFEVINKKEAKREQVKNALNFLKAYATKLRPIIVKKEETKEKTKAKHCRRSCTYIEPGTAENTPEQEYNTSLKIAYSMPVTAREQSRPSKKSRRQSMSQFSKQDKSCNGVLVAALAKLALEPLIK